MRRSCTRPGCASLSPSRTASTCARTASSPATPWPTACPGRRPRCDHVRPGRDLRRRRLARADRERPGCGPRALERRPARGDDGGGAGLDRGQPRGQCVRGRRNCSGPLPRAREGGHRELTWARSRSTTTRSAARAARRSHCSQGRGTRAAHHRLPQDAADRRGAHCDRRACSASGRRRSSARARTCSGRSMPARR